jgi:4-amino-4-deoxy-L-arabinose transferase-like glycosyltransferase
MGEWLAVLALGAALFWAISGRVAAYTYGYDEADYLWIAEKGALAHWLETPSLSLPEFVRLGTGRGQDPAGRKQLSEMVREGGYVDFYRHWHGPLFFYWLTATPGVLAGGEWQARAAQMAFLAAVYVVLYWGVRRLWGMPAAMLCAPAAVISFTNVQTSLQLIPHTLFTLCYTASLLLAAVWMDNGRRGYWYAAVTAAALAFATLEVALVLIVTLAACVWLVRRRWMDGYDRRAWVGFLARSMGVFAATVALVWPAGLFKLSFLKAYAFMAYLALFRKAAWGGESVWASWWTRIQSSPVEWLLFAGGLAYVLWKRREAVTLAPLAIYGVLMIAAVGKVAADERMFLIPRYQAPYLTALLVLGCLAAMRAVGGRGAARQWAAAAVLAALLGWNTWRQFTANPVPARFPLSEVIAGLRGSSLNGKTVLVPQGMAPVLRYYVRDIRFRGYPDELQPSDAPDAARSSGADGVVWIDKRGLPLPGTDATGLSRALSGERIAYYRFGGAQ